jgi:leucyl/phenylalanyl-tRNA--protein transferase
MRRYEIRFDTDFDAVIRACAGPRPTGGHWIHEGVMEAYTELHRLGWAHSVEAWDPESSALVGGLYGVAIGGLFAGESMFHHARDASKVALVALVEQLHPEGVLDLQWVTPHLASLGAVSIPATEYQARLEHALTLAMPEVFLGSA